MEGWRLAKANDAENFLEKNMIRELHQSNIKNILKYGRKKMRPTLWKPPKLKLSAEMKVELSKAGEGGLF